MQENLLKIPNSIESERYIIGCLLLYPETVSDVLNQLRSIDFFDERNKDIFSIIEKLDSKNIIIDQTTVVNELNVEGKLEKVGGIDYIYDIITSVPSVANIEAYTQLVSDKASERRLYEVVNEIREDILQGRTSHDDLMIQSENKFNKVVNDMTAEGIVRVDNLTESVIQMIESNKDKDNHLVGLDTGYDKLNELTSGFKKGELIILAARPAIGKSTFALNLATNIARRSTDGKNKGVAFFSLEMGYDQLIMRLLSTYSSVDLSRVVSGDITNDEMGLLMQAQTGINKLQLYFDQSANSTLRYIKLQCQKLKKEGKLDFIVIDYLQLLSSGDKDDFGANRVNVIGKISRGLKEMARTFEVPVLALSQLSRSIETREDKTPVLADLRESGNIEQDADIVMFLHREQPKKDENGVDTTRIVHSAKTDVIIAKNRQGTTGKFSLVFKGATNQFVSMEDKK